MKKSTVKNQPNTLNNPGLPNDVMTVDPTSSTDVNMASDVNSTSDSDANFNGNFDANSDIDPRRNANSDINSGENASSQSAQPNSDGQSADSALAQANAQIAELTSDLQRTRADFENYRKQIEMQKSQAATLAKYAVVDKFLPLIDNFERALQTYPEQLAPLAKSFAKSLKDVGLQRIDSAPGTEFDPDLHEAVMVEESDDDTDTEVITETLRPGYTYEGSVIRTAMVKVKH